MDTFKTVAEIVKFAADTVTLILGITALWALLFHRKKIALMFRVLSSAFLNERVKRIKETLGKLDSLNYDEKQDRREIFALLGQVSGQIKCLPKDQIGFDALGAEIAGIIAKTSPLTEAKKRSIVYELHGKLDTYSFDESQKMLE